MDPRALQITWKRNGYFEYWYVDANGNEWQLNQESDARGLAISFVANPEASRYFPGCQGFHELTGMSPDIVPVIEWCEQAAQHISGRGVEPSGAPRL